MTTVRALQQKLVDLGFNPGPVDGLIGPNTLREALAALSLVRPQMQGIAETVPRPKSKYLIMPEDWMPWATMQRIVFHWTAGGNKASANDKSHYHFLFEGDSSLVRGDRSVKDNDAPIRGPYAAHTLNCNSDSIGTSLCGMAGAKESPFNAGKSPITKESWDAMVRGHADLCIRYSITPTPSTLLSHAEVQETLGIKQKGKWDIARLPWDSSIKGAKAVGDRMREQVAALI